MKSNTLSLILFALPAYFAASLAVEAVVPPPDGAYPNFTTAEGQNALQDLTSGTGNTALGAYSLFSTTTGSFNTAVGAGALDLNTGDSNTAVGVAALLLNTGTQNTAVGAAALELNDTGSSNTATGNGALFSNTTGYLNTANGASALLSNTGGANNTAMGVSALGTNTTGNDNTAVGVFAGQNNSDGNYNTAIGYQALNHNISGNDNTAIGDNALSSVDGNDNTAVGFNALINNTSYDNTAVGVNALLSNTNAAANTAIGVNALNGNTSGQGNTAVGISAGANVTTASSVICVGSVGENVDNSCYIGNIFGAVAASGVQVFVDSSDRLGTSTSSKRFKDEIKPMDKASEALYALKPVAFRYKKEIDPAGTPQFGLVAEEVERVNPDLIVRDKEGKPYSVRYDQVNAMLLNEFLKEHRKVQELEAMIATQQKDFQTTTTYQQKQIEALTVGLQKVSAQLGKANPSLADLR